MVLRALGVVVPMSGVATGGAERAVLHLLECLTSLPIVQVCRLSPHGPCSLLGIGKTSTSSVRLTIHTVSNDVGLAGHIQLIRQLKRKLRRLGVVVEIRQAVLVIRTSIKSRSVAGIMCLDVPRLVLDGLEAT